MAEQQVTILHDACITDTLQLDNCSRLVLMTLHPALNAKHASPLVPTSTPSMLFWSDNQCTMGRLSLRSMLSRCASRSCNATSAIPSIGGPFFRGHHLRAIFSRSQDSNDEHPCWGGSGDGVTQGSVQRQPRQTTLHVEQRTSEGPHRQRPWCCKNGNVLA